MVARWVNNKDPKVDHHLPIKQPERTQVTPCYDFMKKQALGGFILGGMLIVSSIAIFYSMISNIEPLMEVGDKGVKSGSIADQ